MALDKTAEMTELTEHVLTLGRKFRAGLNTLAGAVLDYEDSHGESEFGFAEFPDAVYDAVGEMIGGNPFFMDMIRASVDAIKTEDFAGDIAHIEDAIEARKMAQMASHRD